VNRNQDHILASFPGLHAQLLSLAVRKVGEGRRSGRIYHVMRAAADVAIVEVIYIYIYADAVKQSIIRVKLGKLSELRISEITSADFSGIIQQTWSCSCRMYNVCMVMFIARGRQRKKSRTPRGEIS